MEFPREQKNSSGELWSVRGWNKGIQYFIFKVLDNDNLSRMYDARNLYNESSKVKKGIQGVLCFGDMIESTLEGDVE